MNWRSVWAVAAAVIVGIVVTTLIDIALHLVGFFPPLDQPIDDVQSLVATSYRVVIGVACAWLTARLAPANPMKHVMILGAIGALAALAGVVATWNAGLGPHWYPISLAVLALPQSWLGGWLFEGRGAGDRK
jgi:hypothetical protein